MSFTTLKAIERCPLQWSLGHAAYPEIWSEPGYPERPYTAVVAGRVIHAALETLTNSLAHAGVTSAAHPDAVTVLKDLGGISGVLQREVQRSLDKLRYNPRAVNS